VHGLTSGGCFLTCSFAFVQWSPRDCGLEPANNHATGAVRHRDARQAELQAFGQQLLVAQGVQGSGVGHLSEIQSRSTVQRNVVKHKSNSTFNRFLQKENLQTKTER